MKIIGILGGVASGKSAVAARLKELGAAVLDADIVAHEVLTEATTKAAIRERFGNGVFDGDDVNRSALARVVFADTNQGRSALADLEAIMHPRIGQRLQKKIQEIDAEIVVLDAAVMMKAGWHQLCDVLLFVEVAPEVRVQRSLARGWSEEEVATREAKQTPVAQKRAAADFIIDNSGELQDTYAQVDQFWRNYAE